MTRFILLSLLLFASCRPYDVFDKWANHYFKDEPAVSGDLLRRIAQVESSMDARAISPAGARGIMQIEPETFRWIQSKEPALAGLHVDELFNVDVNVRAATWYLRWLWDQWPNRPARERLKYVLGSYNAGIGHIRRADKDTWARTEIALCAETSSASCHQTQKYVREILP